MFGNTTTADDPASIVGVERIEVVKGPNSTMYGGGVRSPLGGLINLVSERPELKASGYLAFRGGSFTTLDPYGDFNVPINAKVAARIAGEYQSNDGWVDLVDADRWSAQPSMLFHLSPMTDLFVQGKFNHHSQLEYSGIPAEPAMAGRIDRSAFAGAPIGQPHTTLDNRMATVEINHAFTDALALEHDRALLLQPGERVWQLRVSGAQSRSNSTCLPDLHNGHAYKPGQRRHLRYQPGGEPARSRWKA